MIDTDVITKQRDFLIGLGSVMLAASFLRFFNLNFQSLWLDELYTVVPTTPDNSISSLIEYCKTDQPPLYFLYTRALFSFFGYSEIIARSASAIIGIAGVSAMFFLGREFRDNRTGLFAAVLTAFSYFHIYYSQEARFYAMAFLLTTLSYLFFFRAYKYLKFSDFAFYALFTSGLLYTHYYGLIIFGIQFITFLILLKYNRDRRFIAGGILSGILVALSFTPWLPTILYDAGLTQTWMSKPKATFLADYFYAYTGKDAVTTVIYLALIVVFFRFVRNEQKNKESYVTIITVILACWIVLGYLLPFIRSQLSTPMLHVRYTIVILPAWFTLMAIALSSLTERWRASIAAVLIITSLANLFLFRRHYFKIVKTQFRESSAFVLSNNSQAFPVYSSLDWHYNFYFRNSNLKVTNVADDRYQNEKVFWLLEGHFFSKGDHELLVKKISSQYDIVQQQKFFDSEAILFKVKE